MATFIVNALDAVLFTDTPDDKTVIHDNIVFSDSATVIARQTVYVADRVHFNTVGKTVYSVNVYDTVDFIEGPKNILSLYASDTARFLDAGYRVATYIVAVHDNVAFDDTPSDRYDFSEVLTDNIAFVDTPLPVITLTTSDTVDFFDSAEWKLKYVGRDEAVFTDSASIDITYGVLAQDTIEFSEAHKFSLWANASEIVRFLDNTAEVRVRGDAFDNEAVFTDHVQAFNRYKETCADELILSDLIDGNITPYIKWLSDELIVEDDADITAHYRVRQKETIAFSDTLNARMIAHIHEDEEVVFSDEPTASVYWSVPQISDDAEAVFTDSCRIIVSRFVTTEFTNALVAGIGSTEVTMYTSPVEGTSTILNISLCNVIAGTISAQVTLYKGGVTPINIRNDVEIAEGETYVINNIQEEAIQIEDGDEIRVRSSSPNSLDVFLSVIEQTQG